MLKSFHQAFITYALIGTTGVVIDLASYFILVQIGVSPGIASLISVSLGIINNFLLNAFFNFRNTSKLLLRMALFYSVGIFGAILSFGLILLLTLIYDQSAYIAKIASVPLVITLQYWLNKNISFARSTKELPVQKLALLLIVFIVLTISLSVSPTDAFSDEYDNLLGAKALIAGEVIYKDYFSHHMPLMYFIAAPFLLIHGENLIAVRVSFVLLLSIWLFLLAKPLIKKFGMPVYGAFTILMALSMTSNWSHMLMAENIIALGVAHALIILVSESHRKSSYSDLIQYAALGAIPALSAFYYVPLTLLIYSLGFLTYYRSRATLSRKQAISVIIVALIPYLVLSTYLSSTHSWSYFIDQSFRFNSMYYSQFTPSSPSDMVSGVITLVNQSLSSIYQAMNPYVGQSELKFLISLQVIAVTTSLILLFKKRKWGYLFSLGLSFFLANGRKGVLYLFSADGDARHAVIIFTVAVLLSLISLSIVNNLKPMVQPWVKMVKYVSLAFLLFTTLYCLSATAASLNRLYKQGSFATIASPNMKNNIPKIVNLINTQGDYYWTAPLDFGSQIFIDSINASKYRFFLPWHAVCERCVQEIDEDINKNKPKVIYLDKSATIWGHLVAEYSLALTSSYESNYYQVEDPRLEHFYFLKEEMDYINAILISNGYDATVMGERVVELH